MSTLTGKYLNLVKPALTDDYKVTIGTDLPANFQKIDDEFSAHLAENASKHITSSGQNENGRYIKFDDGTMICFRYITLLVGNFEEHVWVFPATFYTASNLFVRHFIYGNDALYQEYSDDCLPNLVISNVRIVSQPASVTQNIFIPKAASGIPGNFSAGISSIAIGRWK